MLEIVKHIAPGLVIDLGEPLARRLPPWALCYCVLGFAAAIIQRACSDYPADIVWGKEYDPRLSPRLKR